MLSPPRTALQLHVYLFITHLLIFTFSLQQYFPYEMCTVGHLYSYFIATIVVNRVTVPPLSVIISDYKRRMAHYRRYRHSCHPLLANREAKLHFPLTKGTRHSLAPISSELKKMAPRIQTG